MKCVPTLAASRLGRCLAWVPSWVPRVAASCCVAKGCYLCYLGSSLRPGRVARCCVSSLIRLTAATGHPRPPSRSDRLGRQANASRDMRRPRGTSNHGALLANSLRIAACGLQKEPREQINPAKQCTLLACIKHTGNDRVPEIGRERPLTQCARAANPRAASCKPVDTKIPFIHTSPLHITSLLQSMGFASKGVLNVQELLTHVLRAASL